MKAKLSWADKVDPKDLDGAEDYLTLKYTDKVAEEICELFKSGDVVMHRADDILRICGLQPLSVEEPNVRKALIQLVQGNELGPVLISSWADNTMEIVNGYHRTSAAYWIDPDTDCACVVSVGGVPDED